MICPKCGAEIQENQLFCTNCGSSLSTAAFDQPDQNTKPAEQHTSYQSPQQPAAPSSYQDPSTQQVPQNQQPYYQQNPNGQQTYYANAPLNSEPQLPMKWYKFLIYFSLFASAVVNAINAIRYFTGSIYGSKEDAEMVYRHIDGLRNMDILYAVLLLGYAAFAIVTRFALAGYKKNGLTLLYIFYGAGILTLLFYFIVLSILSSPEVMSSVSPSYIESIACSTVVFVLNIVYFRKRKHLFVN